MIDRRWFTILVGLLGLLLAALILLQPGLWANLVAPVTQVFWLLLRVLLSVHQKLYWGLLLFAAGVYWYVRLIGRLETRQEESAPQINNTLESVEHWRAMMALTQYESDRPNSLKQELAALLVAIAAAKQHDPAGIELYDAFRRGRIPLPPETRAFLFPAEPQGARSSLRQVLRRLAGTPRRWFDSWTGRDVTRYYQSIEAALRFMEAYMESNDDDRPVNPTVR
jgi:hypothetical protein